MEHTDPVIQTLLDRIAIQDLFTRYYGSLDAADPQGFGRYFVEGAELDVNGLVARGQQEIAELYRKVGADKPKLTGTFHMLLTNAHIEVSGTTAKASFLWTQILNDQLKGAPRLIEQGREQDLLVKTNGQWRITRRVVTADSGLPDLFDKTYTPREDFRL
jgi:hypothetical protein